MPIPPVNRQPRRIPSTHSNENIETQKSFGRLYSFFASKIPNGVLIKKMSAFYINALAKTPQTQPAETFT
jgi:hypothetical protein